MAKFMLISGCSGGGKSTLIDALRATGFRTIPEPGRRIVMEERAGDGAALPWVDMAAFARRAIALAWADLEDADMWSGPVFFDRGLVDAAVALERATRVSVATTLGTLRPYHSPVFLAPPWSELFQSDETRRHDFDEAVAEYDALTAAFEQLGYTTGILPKVSVAERVHYILEAMTADD